MMGEENQKLEALRCSSEPACIRASISLTQKGNVSVKPPSPGAHERCGKVNMAIQGRRHWGPCWATVVPRNVVKRETIRSVAHVATHPTQKRLLYAYTLVNFFPKTWASSS